MDRRTFTLTALGSAVSTLLPQSTSASAKIAEADSALKHKIVSSFADQALIASDKSTGFLMVSRPPAGSSVAEDLTLMFTKMPADQTTPYKLDDVFVDDIEESDYTDYDRSNTVTPDALEVSAIVRAANQIAKKTRRGRGNYYAVFHDHILVWYKGKSEYDTPVARMGKNVIINPNHRDYFYKIKGITLTEEHHEYLELAGLTRIM